MHYTIHCRILQEKPWSKNKCIFVLFQQATNNSPFWSNIFFLFLTILSIFRKYYFFCIFLLYAQCGPRSIKKGQNIHVFLDLIKLFIYMRCSFGPKSRDNPLKCFQKILVNFQDSWSMHGLEVTIFKYDCYRDEGIDQLLSLKSKRESIGLHWAEKFTFEYWSCY